MTRTWMSGLLIGLAVAAVAATAIVAPTASVLTAAVIMAAALPSRVD